MNLLLSLGLFAVATSAELPADTDAHAEHRAACIQAMEINAEELKVGLHEYRISRCVQERVTRALQSGRYLRAEERLDRISSQFRGRIREGKRFLSPENQERFDPEKDPTPIRARAFSRRELLRSIDDISDKDAQKQRSLLLQERMSDARNACRNVPRSFYQNCVRETIRTLGQSSEMGEIPTTRKY
jgi:hypothetical protein